MKPALVIDTVGVVGAGLMGIGIAASFLLAGFRVRIVDVAEELINKAKGSLRDILQSSISKMRGKVLLEECLRRSSLSTSFDDFRTCQLVVEAVFENLKVKQDVFRKLSTICSSTCLICTNTSSLDISDIAVDCSDPERIAGMHFFSPAHIMRLVEVVVTASTSDSTIRSILDVVKRINKVGVVVRNNPGFVGNRMIFNYILESMQLLEEGASVEQVDRLMVDFGFPMGPFQMQDLSGLDVGYKIRMEAGLREPSMRYSKIGDALYELGRLGCKNGKGFYRYEQGSRVPLPDPAVEEILIQFRRRDVDSPSDQEIRARLIYPLINEAFKILADGGVVSMRPGDIDAIFVLGYGWPSFTGGVLFYAQNFVGIRETKDALQALSQRFPSSPYFTPAPILDPILMKNISICEIQSSPSIMRELSLNMMKNHPKSRL